MGATVSGPPDAEHSVQTAGESSARAEEADPESVHSAEPQGGSPASPSRRGDV